MTSIKKSPINPTTFLKHTHYSSACRVAFRHLIKNLDFGNRKILLPSYIGWSVNEGSGVFDPIVECQLGYEFYKVKQDLSIDVKDFKEKLMRGDVKVAMIIHYFGFLQSEIETIVALCRENNVLLIEDCAHTLTSRHDGITLGKFGDFSLFSLQKVLPVLDGGILSINNSDYFSIPALNDRDRISQNTLEIFCTSQLEKISDIRRKNYILLAKHLKSLDGIEVMYPKLAEGIVPQNFPVLIKNLGREEVYFAMIERGIRVIALYYKLIDPINMQNYPVSYDISNRILNLPIHQDLTAENMRFIAENLADILQES